MVVWAWYRRGEGDRHILPPQWRFYLIRQTTFATLLLLPRVTSTHCSLTLDALLLPSFVSATRDLSGPPL